MAEWFVYILECADGSLYTGITNNIEKRLQQHQDGTGAKYTRGRAPHAVVFQESHPDRASASRRENEIKSLERNKKLALIGKAAL